VEQKKSYIKMSTNELDQDEIYKALETYSLGEGPRLLEKVYSISEKARTPPHIKGVPIYLKTKKN